MKQFLAKYPLDPREKSKKHQRILLALTCAALLCAALCVGVLGLLYGSLYFVSARLLSYFQHPMLVFLNLLPGVLLAFFLYFLTNRAWLAFLLTSLPALSFTSMYVVPGRRGRMGICSMPRLSRGVPASTMSGTSAERRRSSGAIPAV